MSGQTQGEVATSAARRPRRFVGSTRGTEHGGGSDSISVEGNSALVPSKISLTLRKKISNTPHIHTYIHHTLLKVTDTNTRMGTQGDATRTHA